MEITQNSVIPKENLPKNAIFSCIRSLKDVQTSVLVCRTLSKKMLPSGIITRYLHHQIDARKLIRTRHTSPRFLFRCTIAKDTISTACRCLHGCLCITRSNVTNCYCKGFTFLITVNHPQHRQMLNVV